MADELPGITPQAPRPIAETSRAASEAGPVKDLTGAVKDVTETLKSTREFWDGLIDLARGLPDSLRIFSIFYLGALLFMILSVFFLFPRWDQLLQAALVISFLILTGIFLFKIVDYLTHRPVPPPPSIPDKPVVSQEPAVSPEEAFLLSMLEVVSAGGTDHGVTLDEWREGVKAKVPNMPDFDHNFQKAVEEIKRKGWVSDWSFPLDHCYRLSDAGKGLLNTGFKSSSLFSREQRK